MSARFEGAGSNSAIFHHRSSWTPSNCSAPSNRVPPVCGMPFVAVTIRHRPGRVVSDRSWLLDSDGRGPKLPIPVLALCRITDSIEAGLLTSLDRMNEAATHPQSNATPFWPEVLICGHNRTPFPARGSGPERMRLHRGQWAPVVLVRKFFPRYSRTSVKNATVESNPRSLARFATSSDICLVLRALERMYSQSGSTMLEVCLKRKQGERETG